jgi:transposase-like protein
MEAMTRHRSHSAAFKRQVAEEFIAGETLHALSKRHDISRQLIRIWVGKFEAGALDEDVQAAELIQGGHSQHRTGDSLPRRRRLEHNHAHDPATCLEPSETRLAAPSPRAERRPAQRPSVPFGTAPTAFSAFLSPANAVNGWVWGFGPIALLPTSSSRSLGSNVWGIGPGLIIVKTAGPVVAGGLISNVFSLGGTSGRNGTKYSVFSATPFFNYNFKEGWFVGTQPIVTAIWSPGGPGGERWTLPVGAQAGRVVKIGRRLPVALLVGAYYNVVRPQFGATWQLRTQMAIIF